MSHVSVSTADSVSTVRINRPDKLNAMSVDVAAALIDTFTEKFFSHGYPMDASFLRENGIDVSGLDYETGSTVYELMDQYTEASRAGGGGVTVIQSDAGHTVIRGDGGVARKPYRDRQKSRP